MSGFFLDKLIIEKLDGTEPTTGENTVRYGDCNNDGKVNLLDLILLRKYLAKWDVSFGG